MTPLEMELHGAAAMAPPLRRSATDGAFVDDGGCVPLVDELQADEMLLPALSPADDALLFGANVEDYDDHSQQLSPQPHQPHPHQHHLHQQEAARGAFPGKQPRGAVAGGSVDALGAGGASGGVRVDFCCGIAQSWGLPSLSGRNPPREPPRTLYEPPPAWTPTKSAAKSPQFFYHHFMVDVPGPERAAVSDVAADAEVPRAERAPGHDFGVGGGSLAGIPAGSVGSPSSVRPASPVVGALGMAAPVSPLVVGGAARSAVRLESSSAATAAAAAFGPGAVGTHDVEQLRAGDAQQQQQQQQLFRRADVPAGGLRGAAMHHATAVGCACSNALRPADAAAGRESALDVPTQCMLCSALRALTTAEDPSAMAGAGAAAAAAAAATAAAADDGAEADDARRAAKVGAHARRSGSGGSTVDAVVKTTGRRRAAGPWDDEVAVLFAVAQAQQKKYKHPAVAAAAASAAAAPSAPSAPRRKRSSAGAAAPGGGAGGGGRRDGDGGTEAVGRPSAKMARRLHGAALRTACDQGQPEPNSEASEALRRAVKRFMEKRRKRRWAVKALYRSRQRTAAVRVRAGGRFVKS